MQKETVLDKVQVIVDWWLNIPADFTGLSELMHKRQVLSAHLYTIACDMAKAREAWADAAGINEGEKNKARVKFMITSTSVEKSNYQARANTAKYFELEKKGEAVYYSMKHHYDAVVEILSTMNQRIAILRREWEYKNITNGV